MSGMSREQYGSLTNLEIGCRQGMRVAKERRGALHAPLGRHIEGTTLPRIPNNPFFFSRAIQLACPGVIPSLGAAVHRSSNEPLLNDLVGLPGRSDAMLV